MNRLLIILCLATFSCSDRKTTVTEVPASDTLMDSTTIKAKADTTVKMLDHLDDSINKLKNKAAGEAN